MGVIYEQAEESVHAIAMDIIGQYHPDLKEKEDRPGSGIRLCILMASNEDAESEEPPVKCHGYASYAVASIIPYIQRVDKRADAQIIIDKDRWEDLMDRRRRALLDHEINHLQVVRDKDGFIKTDDAGRPKLEMRLHDYQIGGFRIIAQRYEADAIEVVEGLKFRDTFGDVVMPAGEKLFA